MKTLSGKVVAITGAASGMGRALAIECASRGSDLALVDVDVAGLDETVRRVRAARPGVRVEAERLDVPELVRDLTAAGVAARELPSVDAIVETVAREARDGDDVLVMSNGGFGGIHGKLLEALA